MAGDWVNFLVRWTHLIAGISWIGSSFYFMWLDASLEAPAEPSEKIEGELWMVHSGGFYQVQRRRIGPGSMPKTLHWFKYEALFTWLTGFFLLGWIYYLNGGAYLVDPTVLRISSAQATGLSLGLISVSWIVYDLLWNSLGRKWPGAATVVSLLGVAGLAFVLCAVFSGRGAFIHLGAIFGTIMVANVWMRILPSQQKMIDATARGERPDFTLSGYAKRRSVHNSYMTFPVLLMMVSNHYPMAYGSHSRAVVLVLLVVFGMAVRHVMIGKNELARKASVPGAVAALLALGFLTAQPAPPAAATPADLGPPVHFSQAHAIITSRCLACHSEHPADPTFGPMPGGVSFETVDRIHALATRIKDRAVITKTMPMLNKTGITEEERTLLGRWVDQGARIEEPGAHVSN
jgi:uncharacterized membrane protein